MLKRNNPPNQGLWNGVGGHIRPEESPTSCVLREIYEETGYSIPKVNFCGLLTWEGFEIPNGGLYIFKAPAPSKEPNLCNEGILKWKDREWVFHSQEVVSNIHHFGPHVLVDDVIPMVYHFKYENGRILEHEIKAIPDWININ